VRALKSAAIGSCLFGFGDCAIEALINATRNGLGRLLQPHFVAPRVAQVLVEPVHI
jgi:hypothetical protein